MAEPAIRFEVFDVPPDSILQVIEAGLEEHNHAAAPIAEVRPLAVVAKSPSGDVLGGAVGRTWGGCCELLQLWVLRSHRGQGVASRLLADFEASGATRRCHTFYLTTLSYQAPEFYRKRGYTEIARITGYPDGIVKYLMQKHRSGD